MGWRGEPTCKPIKEVLDPQSVIDVGCACGDLIKGFEDLGITCYGLEGAKTVIPYLMVDESKVFFEDLRLPLNINHFFDLVICFEVAEHIEPEYADQFVDNLTKLSWKILMSAAPVGQGGHYHVNCQPYEYWIYKFAVRGYIYNPTVCEKIKTLWEPWKKKPGILAFYRNLLYFERSTHESRRNNHGDEKA